MRGWGDGSRVSVHKVTLKLLMLWAVVSTSIALYCFWSDDPISPVWLLIAGVAFPVVVIASFYMYGPNSLGD